eukprot:1148328-Pelagomonas_calceolata.AAC.3
MTHKHMSHQECVNIGSGRSKALLSTERVMQVDGMYVVVSSNYESMRIHAEAVQGNAWAHASRTHPARR